jgi:beta-lactamase regulating signal transducer with metallopeptidase domain
VHPFFLYLIVSTICLSVCYLVYLLLFRHDSGFAHLRSFLLISMLISVLFPLAPLRIQNHFLYHQQAVGETVFNTDHSEIQADQDISSDTLKDPDVKASHLNVLNILSLIYLVIAPIILLSMIIQIIKISSIYLTSDRTVQDGITVVTSRKVKTPFSFFSWIFLPKATCDADEIDKILAHEKIHAEKYHSIDLLLANLLSGFMWFNPLAWRMRYSVEQVHEYLADEGALKTGIDRKDYMALLLNRISEAQIIPLHSSFNRSLVAQRMHMITKGNTYRQSRFKILVLIPLSVLLLLAIACVNGNNRLSKATENPDDNMVLAVEAGKRNVIYLGVNNPVVIAASGVNSKDLTVSIDNGRIRKVGENYIINPAHFGTATVSIYGKGQLLGSREFRVLELPFPQAYLVSSERLISDGPISLADLRSVKGIVVEIPDFIFDVDFAVVSFNVTIRDSDGNAIIQKSENNGFTNQQTDLIESLRPGQELKIDGIRAIGPDGRTRNLDPFVFKISG